MCKKKMPNEKPMIYLAGPDVFSPNAIDIGRRHKSICKWNGYNSFFPYAENVVATNPFEVARAITNLNMYMIQDCDIIIANLSNFRGTCDSGTAWECGYGLALGKTVIVYTKTSNDSIPNKIVENVHAAFSVNLFEDIFNILHKIVLPEKKSLIDEFMIPRPISLDPKSDEIKDVDPIASFILGYRKGKNLSTVATLTDMRSQLEKYGSSDEKGNEVEDFGLPCNIMISLNADIFPVEY